MMKLHLLSLCLLLAAPAFPLHADELADSTLSAIERHIQQNPNVTLTQPAQLSQRLKSRKATAATETSDESPTYAGGYRVQVFSSNNTRTGRGEAQSRANAISDQFPDWAAYVTFDAPYWRVKVGDFRSYEDAHAALSTLKAQFPAFAREMRLVRDKIKL